MEKLLGSFVAGMGVGAGREGVECLALGGELRADFPV